MTDKKKYPVDEIETMKGEDQKEDVSDLENVISHAKADIKADVAKAKTDLEDTKSLAKAKLKADAARRR